MQHKKEEKGGEVEEREPTKTKGKLRKGQAKRPPHHDVSSP